MYDDDYYDRRAPRNPMATASVVLGVLALLSCSIFYIALPCGALAIICAILSRNHIMAKRSIVGIVCGLLGIILSICITIYALIYVLTDTNGRSWLEYYLQTYTGDYDLSLDEFLNGLYGTDGSSSDSENGENDRSLLPDGSSGDDSNSLPDGNSGNDNSLPGDNNGGSNNLPGNNNNNNSGNGDFIHYEPENSGGFANQGGFV